MSNIVELPNGASWDNDLAFADQSDGAKFYMMETLKLALMADEAVERRGIVKKNPSLSMARGEDLAYSELIRDSLKLTADRYYTHVQWSDFINTGEMIPDSEFFDETKWLANGVNFHIKHFQ